MSSGSTLPQEGPSNSHSTSPSPPTGGNRRIRSKVHEPLITMSPGSSTGPGLVNYLKQLHGLTKKRNYGPKASKRNSAAEPSRATGSRPILPRLSLPAPSAQVPTWPVGSPKVTPPQSAAETSTSVVNQRYTPIAPAKRARPTSPGAPAEQEDGRGRRWPWIKPGSISPPVKEPTQGTSTDHALRSLEAIPPKPPALGMRLPDEIEPPVQHASPTVYDTGHAQTTLPSPHEQPPTYPAYGSYSESSSQHHEEQTFSHSAANNSFPTLNSAFTSGAQTYSGMNGYHYNPPIPSSSQPPAPHMDSLHQPSSSALSYQPDYGYPSGFAPAQHDYGVSPTSSHHSHNGTPLPSPSLTSPVGPAVDEGEDQPFVITPEYEAFANAQFAEAVRSGAMQASMTPGVLTPSVAGPYPQSGGYFADPMLQHQETMIASNPALQQGAMLSHANYTYAGSSYAGPSHDDAFYHQAPGIAVPEPGSSHAYYTHGDDPSAQHPQWYGLP
ncbi:hypothetical protein PHLCEN_2v9718 [Hermanssonia centrifuga]|uniref:Uncharacterized protein n=1 Tax=Hermanssonia centrifuga TaxID=98765 RepID=A0A2R6NQ00_9APHY|nr:hypothetical protein PHLCEN_2v9718 [Hermanssonia centrifuga]